VGVWGDAAGAAEDGCCVLGEFGEFCGWAEAEPNAQMAAIPSNNAITGRVRASWLAFWRMESIGYFLGLGRECSAGSPRRRKALPPAHLT